MNQNRPVLGRKSGYGNPYVLDTSPLELNWSESCVLRHLPSLDEVFFCWSDTIDREMVAVSVIPAYGESDYVLELPEIALKRGEVRTVTRKSGREMFEYLTKQKGWVVQK